MAQTILYYPTIDIQDGAWLRNAILYWDEVSSIVPYENYGNFSPELQYLQRKGVYHPVYPQDLFLSEFAEDFCEAVARRIITYGRAISSKQDRTPTRPVRMHKNKIYAPALHELIHYEKLPPKLLSLFKEKRFINDFDAGGWMEVDSKIAHIYMRTLAEYSVKCSSKDIVLGTDAESHIREIYSTHACMDIKTQCCKINILNCLPQPSMDVGYEQILDFKEKRKDELNAFRAKIRELETNIYHAESYEQIKHYETQFTESWEGCSNDYHKVLKEAKISYFLSSLVCLVATPFVGELMSRTLNRNLSAAIQSAAPLLNIGIGYFDYRSKISPTKTDGGFSYILKANRDGIIRI